MNKLTNQSNSTLWLGLLAIVVAGCAKTERKTVPPPKAPVSAYWKSAILNSKVTAPACVPKGTKVIIFDTPTIFPEGECPKGWQPTFVYYKP